MTGQILAISNKVLPWRGKPECPQSVVRPPALASALLQYIFNQVALGSMVCQSTQLDAAGESSGFSRTTEAAMRLANSASKPLSMHNQAVVCIVGEVPQSRAYTQRLPVRQTGSIVIIEGVEFLSTASLSRLQHSRHNLHRWRPPTSVDTAVAFVNEYQATSS